MAEKPKQIKAYIYPEIYAQLTKSQDFAEHGLSYAVNAELARRFGFALPETPIERKGRGGRKLGVQKNQHVVTLPANWFELLESLTRNQTWTKKDNPQLARYSVKLGLVAFVPRFGAKPTENLRSIIGRRKSKSFLEGIFRDEAAKSGYKLKFETEEK